MDINYENELKAAMDDLKVLLSSAQHRIGIIETFLYLSRKKGGVVHDVHVSANGHTEGPKE